jgi:hypothetical protein
VVRLVAVAAVSLVLAGAAGGGEASIWAWFYFGDRNLYCGTELFPHEGSARFLTCWRPRNGFQLSMTHRGRATARTNRGFRGYQPATSGRLRVGRTVWVSRDRRHGVGRPPRGALFHCTAHPTWLICKNAAGYGWRFGRVRGWQFIVHG